MTSIQSLEGDFFVEPDFELFAKLRSEAPVCWSEADEMWAVARHADIKFISSNPQIFSNEYGVKLTQNRLGLQDPEAVSDPMHRARARSAAQRDAGLKQGISTGPFGQDIIVTDPPRHAFYRKMFSFAFTPRALAKMEEHITALARNMIEQIEPDTLVDFVQAVAVPLPVLVIAEMLGVSGDDLAMFRQWSDSFMELGQPELLTEEQLAFHTQQIAEFVEYFSEQLRARVRQPRDDILTVFATRGEDGDSFSFPEQLGATRVLLLAGNETTRSLISGAGKAMLDFPDERRKLLSNLEQMPAAIEEFLRWVTPLSHMCRTVLEDVKVGGVELRRGDYLALLYQSANRDESVWSNPDVLDLGRDPAGHLAFGFAEHFCVGANLARREARIVLTELLSRFPNFELSGPIERSRNTSSPGLKKLPVVFHREA